MANDRRWRLPGRDAGVWVALSWIVVGIVAVGILALVVFTGTGAQT